MSLSRVPVQIVEIDIDHCAEVYGTAPCTAALSAATARKCFNTFATCQDRANFNKGTLTLRFGRNQGGLPKGTLIYPALRSVGTNPASINLGGIDERTGPLGKRARITVELLDFTDGDVQVDKYRSGRIDGSAQFDAVGYDPRARGTFFGKLRARFPYYSGRALRVLDGYEGEALSAMRTRHYVIDEWAGPDASGRVRIVAKDVLDLADNKKALCPKPSNGKLESDVADTGLVGFDLLPAGVGSEYDASGRAVIGSEIVGFTRSGDTITLTGRALDGSKASTHSASDLFQQCFRVEDAQLADVAEDLMQNYAGIDAAFLPKTDWDDEAVWLAGLRLTATIAKPTGVATLIGEVMRHGVFFWWDDVAQEIKMRANRGLGYGEVAQDFTDAAHVVAGSPVPVDLDKQRLTQVIFWHEQIDATGSATDGANYNRAYVVSNDGGSANRADQDRILEVYSRWLGSGNDAGAAVVAERLANRFEETPRQVTFVLDAKDRANVAPADLITLTSRVLQDVTGQSTATEMQVTSVEENVPGHQLTVVAQTFEFSGRFGFLMQSGDPDYDAASTTEKDLGFYFADETSPDFGDGLGPYLFF